MSHVGLWAGRALRDMGYSQTRWNEEYWVCYRDTGDEDEDWSVEYVDEAPGRHGIDRIAAPDELDALTWLERKHGWRWERRSVTLTISYYCAVNGLVELEAREPDDLIIAIGQYHAAHGLGAQQKDEA